MRVKRICLGGGASLRARSLVKNQRIIWGKLVGEACAPANLQRSIPDVATGKLNHLVAARLRGSKRKPQNEYVAGLASGAPEKCDQHVLVVVFQRLDQRSALLLNLLPEGFG